MKKHLSKLFIAAGLVLSFHTWADTKAGAEDMLLYIQPVEFTNPIKLWHPYSDYWFYQGPVVESVAIDKFRQGYGKVSACEADRTGRALVWLQPKMFYNPQVQVFYGKVTAEVYTGIGKHVASYVGESAVQGLIGASAETYITHAYALAVDEVVSKMKADSAVQTLMHADAAGSAETTPCSMVTLLPVSKIRAMPF